MRHRPFAFTEDPSFCLESSGRDAGVALSPLTLPVSPLDMAGNPGQDAEGGREDTGKDSATQCRAQCAVPKPAGHLLSLFFSFCVFYSGPVQASCRDLCWSNCGPHYNGDFQGPGTLGVGGWGPRSVAPGCASLKAEQETGHAQPWTSHCRHRQSPGAPPRLFVPLN